MENREPLLKEEEDKFYFLNNNDNGKSKGVGNKEFIITGVLSVIVLWLVFYSLFPFYIGFKNFDDAHKSNDIVIKNEEDIPIDSLIVNELHSYIDSKNNNELASLINVYNGEITSNLISDSQKLSVVFKYLGITCGSEKVLSVNEVKNGLVKIFNEDSAISYLDNSLEVEGYVVSKLDDGSLSVSINTCEDTKDFVLKKIIKATSSGDEIYVYEAFGYFINTFDNMYVVYGDGLKTKKLGEYTDENNNREFSDIDSLQQYKWTFKKSNDNSYYFVSVTPVI